MALPHYDTALVRKLAQNVSTRAITIGAEDGCYALGLTLEDVWAVLSDLDSPRCSFHKSMESDKRSGDFFDVYHITIAAKTIYLKFRVKMLRDGREVVVVSFKEK
jgi:hypothetical protein